MKLAAKMIAARECLLRRLQQEMDASRFDDATSCLVRLDRMQLVLVENPSQQLRGLPGYRRFPSRRIRRKPGQRFFPYGRAQWFWNEESEMKFAIESEPQKPWLVPYRLTLIADDRTGLQPNEVFGILELLPNFKLTTLEVAFDFQVRP
jgi:hypothetical protein